MNPVERLITRRDFLRGAAGFGLGAMTGVPSGADERGPLSRVVLVRDPEVVDAHGDPVKAVLAKMLDQAVATLFEEEDAAAAWKRIVTPEDVVGIKSNAWYMPTPEALEEIIRERVLEAGVSETNVDVNDREVLERPVFQNSTALINVRPIRTHFWSGVGGVIKNYIPFVPHPWEYHDDQCADLGALWLLPEVKGKTRLCVLAALTPLFWGRGPHHLDKRFIWDYRGVLVSLDPVALDATGVRLLAAMRLAHFGEDRPLETTPHHVEVADHKFHLGTSDPERIELLKLGWTDGALL